MDILGIETSCDETSAAVVRDGRSVLSNIIVSSLREHQQYGGVIPEIASRRQMEFIYPVVKQALTKAGRSLREIDAVAVASEPGLIGSLLVGISFARALGFALRKPLIQVDHIKAHVYAPFLSNASPRLPAVGLVVSGGHTSLYYIKNFRKFELLGRTLDDAAGEAFDKVARLLGLGYPGGPVIDRLARRAGAGWNGVSFRIAALPGTFDFSFSGIKTAVLYHKQRHEGPYPLKEAARAFQDSVVGVLVDKTLQACQKMKVKTILVGGGVAANSALRQQMPLAARRCGFDVYFPPLEMCMDNAAMIAGLGYHRMPIRRLGRRNNNGKCS